jgi:hypothetical protein
MNERETAAARTRIDIDPPPHARVYARFRDICTQGTRTGAKIKAHIDSFGVRISARAR